MQKLYVTDAPFISLWDRTSIRGEQIFQKSKRHLKTVGARRVT
jgi:hypothetical protein